MLDKFIFAEPADGKRLLIISTDPPFHIGVVSRYTEGIPNSKDWRISICPGYKVFVSHLGFMDKEGATEQDRTQENIQRILQEKAMWYYDVRIHKSQPRFRKYQD